MKKTLYSAIILVLVACSPKTAEVATPKDNQESKVIKEETSTMTAYPNGEIAEGSTLYTAHCAKCHDLPVISRYSKEKWQKIVPSMAKEAKLDAIQENKILSFVNWKLQQQ
jgi:cytochrome c5